MEFSKEQVDQICKGDSEIAGFFHALLEHNRTLREQNRVLTEQNQQLQAIVTSQAEQIVKLEKRVHELERQLGQNSNNSSKPPSSDGFRKKNNLRQSGGKKGAPEGHSGQTLRFSTEPNQFVVHSPQSCQSCHTSLAGVPALKFEARQVFDLPSFTWIVTEHRAATICCPKCRTRTSGAFPVGVNAPVQYGATLSAWTSYLSTYHMLPLERISQLFADLTGHGPSEATLLSRLSQMHTALAPTEQQIREQILSSPVVHADETGCRAEGHGAWMHTVSNAAYTLLTVHESRGTKGMIAGEVLPYYKGTVVHDFYWPYFHKTSFSFHHALCNAHLLRECQGIIEHDKQQWAKEMKELLQEAWEVTSAARKAEKLLPESVIAEIERRYDDILLRGEAQWKQGFIPKEKGTRGRHAKGKAGNLAERFQQYKTAILAFLRDVQIP
ncbi:IS66 family transposase, partial [Cohnella sp. GCM10012308]|uniref:IS66 family transposase n=1 Tax=Cohnella sp. GCM10012308 TaxID=3317329 RepID=UPI0036086056